MLSILPKIIIFVFILLLSHPISCQVQNSLGNLVILWGSNNHMECGDPQHLVDVIPAKPLVDDGIIDKLFIKHMCTGSDNTFVITMDGGFYGWGEDHDVLLGPNGTGNGDSAVPILIYNFDDEEVIKMSCQWQSVYLMTESKKLYGFGKDPNSRFGKSVITSYETPHVIAEEVELFSVDYKILRISNDSRNVYSRGDNEYGKFCNGNLPWGFNNFETEHFMPTDDLDVLIPSEYELVYISVSNYATFQVYKNESNHHLAVGCGDSAKSEFLIQPGSPAETHMLLNIPIYHETGDLRPEMVKSVLQWGCSNACILLVETYNNSVTKTFSYAQTSNQMHLGRSSEDNEYPKELWRGEMAYDEYVISFSLYGLSTRLITQKGRVYAFGFDMYDGTELRGDIVSPSRILRNYTSVSHVANTQYVEMSTKHFAVVSFEFECDGFPPNSELVCSGHGSCFLHDNCSCEEDYFGDFCDEWNCSDLSWRTDLVCSNHGDCIEKENCDCEYGYADENCQNIACYSLSSTSQEVCNDRRGDCEAIDLCECHDPSTVTGLECESVIGEVQFETDELESISFVYKTKRYHFERLNLLDSLWSASFACNVLLPNVSSASECFFRKNEDVTSNLVMYLSEEDQNLKEGDKLFVYSISSVNRFVIREVLKPSSGKSNIWVLFVSLGIFGVLILVFCSILCVVVSISAFSGLIFMKYLVVNQQKISKFNELDNVDLLLSEQRIEKQFSSAKILINKDIFNIDFDDIELIELIGSGGSQSNVYKCKYQGSIYAYKSFRTSNIVTEETNFQEFEREVQILGSFRHRNILRFIGASIKSPRIGILMEFCSNGDLKAFLKKYKEENEDSYPKAEKFRMVKEICSAMILLHSKKVIHRDLKLENVLVDDQKHTKLMDFGLSRFVDDQLNRSLTRGIGTRFFMSPELIRGEKYNELVDVYSFAILFFIVLSEKYDPYKGRGGIEFQVANNPYFRPSLSEVEAESWIKRLIRVCWNHTSKKRPGFKDILKVLNEKRDESTVIYSVMSKSLKKFNFDEAEDFLLKRKTFKELQNVLISKDEEIDGLQMYVHSENGRNIRIINDKDVENYICEDCLVLLIRKDNIIEDSVVGDSSKFQIPEGFELIRKEKLKEYEEEIKNLRNEMRLLREKKGN